jgi:hypothetical protein
MIVVIGMNRRVGHSLSPVFFNPAPECPALSKFRHVVLLGDWTCRHEAVRPVWESRPPPKWHTLSPPLTSKHQNIALY